MIYSKYYCYIFIFLLYSINGGINIFIHNISGGYMTSKNNPAPNSLFFRAITFIVVLVLFTSTTVRAYGDDSSLLTQVLKSVYNVLFDTTTNTTSSGTGGSNMSTAESTTVPDSTSATSRDPLDLPPAPPPPTSN